MERDEEMNNGETTLLGSIKNTISRSSESAMIEFERICESLGWRRSTLLDNQKIKRRRNRTDIYKRVLSDNTRRSAVRDMEIQTDSGYATPPKSYSYNNYSNANTNSSHSKSNGLENPYNNNNNNNNNNNHHQHHHQHQQHQYSPRSRQNTALVNGITKALNRKELPLPQSTFHSPPSINAVSKTMSTQTQTSISPDPPRSKEVSSGLLTPERSSTSISSSIDADPVSTRRKHNITPSPTLPKRSFTRPTIQEQSPGSVKQLRSQIEEQLKSPYRSPTTSRFNHAEIHSPERRASWADISINTSSSQQQNTDKQDMTSPIRTTSPIRSPYTNGSPSRKRNMFSPSNEHSPPRKKYIPESPGSVKRLASQIENELKFPYLRPGMVVPKLTSSPIKKAESPIKPSNVLHKVAMKHHQNHDLDFKEEDERIARLEREIKNVGKEVSLLSSYNILDSPKPSHVPNGLPKSPITPTTPTLTRTNDPSFIPKAPPFIKRPAKELIKEAEMKRMEQPIIRETPKPKVLKPTEMHKLKMREIITLVPHFKLRKTNMIPGPDGEMISNPFWNEIYQPKIRN